MNIQEKIKGAMYGSIWNFSRNDVNRGCDVLKRKFILTYVFLLTVLLKMMYGVYKWIESKLDTTTDVLLNAYVKAPTYKAKKTGRNYSNKWKLRELMAILHKRGKLWCSYCGEKFNFITTFPSIDHIIPSIRGGSDNIKNLTPCCKLCNVTKSADIWEVKYPNEGFGIKGEIKAKLRG